MRQEEQNCLNQDIKKNQKVIARKLKKIKKRQYQKSISARFKYLDGKFLVKQIRLISIDYINKYTRITIKCSEQTHAES